MLDVWPALPIIAVFDNDHRRRGIMDNFIAALECTDRVCHIYFQTVGSMGFDIFLAAMQQPFPELTYMSLWSVDETVAVVPDSFLGGSAPRLQYLEMNFIPFPGLPKLLLSATHLVDLHLYHIPHSGYFSPDGMVVALSTFISLSNFFLEFESPRSCPDPASRRPPPSTRSVLPLLGFFSFKGVSEYLDDMACIDAPQLNMLEIIFFNDIVFDTPQLVQFISLTPMSKALEEAYITLRDRAARVNFLSQTSRDGTRMFKVDILCEGLDWQASSLEQVCTSCLPPLSILEDLYFYKDFHPDRKEIILNRHWLELLRPFITVKNLYLSEEFASHIAPALQELVEGRATDVLPALQNIFLKGLESSGSVQESIGQFVDARQVANHPIGISPWAD